MPPTEETPLETAQFEAMMKGEAPPPEPPPAEPPPVAPAPAAPAAPPAAAPEPDKPVRLVPHQALHEERTKRQSLERELATLRAQPAPAPAKQPDSDDIDETQDPIGAIAKLKAEIRESKERETEAKRVNEQLADVSKKVGARINAYKAEHPEYGDQIQFLRKSRFDELSELGYDQDQAIAQMQQEEIVIGIQALQNDWDPGAKIAQLARLRGWKAADPTPTPTPPATPAADKKLDRIEKGQRAAISPSSAGGGGPEPSLSLADLSNLEGAAFDKAFDKFAATARKQG